MSKTKKIITSMLLVIAMVVLAVQPAFAAEHETWYIDHQGNYKASYTFKDDNLTPYKIMGDTARLVVFGSFKKNEPFNNNSASNIQLTFEIRDHATGKLISPNAKAVVKNTNFPNTNSFMVECTVYKGQQIEFYLDASSINNPPGYTRSCYVDYSAYLAPL